METGDENTCKHCCLEVMGAGNEYEYHWYSIETGGASCLYSPTSEHEVDE